ncbi:uncharacterized protein LOC117650779 [Thrips palmi]|uniref:Uncharacterized protein LOC117650779 n=1 Tax=Thrips palmi TaxID=161013 RepID=A0A6P8ZXY3_THRPL|nr:uncharacterized protein LOC117650779 [Thrips palmi]
MLGVQLVQAVAHVVLELAHLDAHLLAHQVVAHGDEPQAQQQVDEVDDQPRLAAVLVRVDGGARHEVAEADLAQARHAEVAAVQVAPALPLGEHDGAGEHVAADDPEAGRGRHDDPRPRALAGGPLRPLRGALVQAGVEPAERLRQHLAHVHEVQHVERHPEHGVHHGGRLAPHGARYQVAEADHGEDGQREHEGGGERPHVAGCAPVVALAHGLHDGLLELHQRVVDVVAPPRLVEDVELLRDAPQRLGRLVPLHAHQL